MKGWAQDVTLGTSPVETEQPNAIGLVIAPKFPDREVLREALQRGVKAEPDAVWVLRGEPRGDDATAVAAGVLRDLGVEPFFARTNRAWWGSSASAWRDAELIATTKMVLVFHDLASPTTQAWADHPNYGGKLHIITRGKKKPKARKGRKPVGV